MTDDLQTEAVRLCEGCGVEMPRPPKRSAAYWAARRFCSQACMKSPAAEKRKFWAQTVTDPDTGCINCTHIQDKDGYGIFYFQGHRWRSHRLSLFWAKGSIDSALSVLHSCDNPPCVNAEHLREGTISDNAKDMVERGRGVDNRGANNPMAKLSDEAASLIRASVKSNKALAKEFGCSPSLVSLIKLNKRRSDTGTTSMPAEEFAAAETMLREARVELIRISEAKTMERTDDRR